MIQPHDEENKGTLESLGYAESFFGHTGRKFYGRYRGKVAANVDPLGQGRLSVTVPDVYGLFPKMWARPSVPFAGPLMGTYVCPPPVGAGVWVEFEQGSPQKPVWVGCYWDDQPVPAEAGLMANAATKTGPGTPFMTHEVASAGTAVTQVPLPLPVAPVPGTVTHYSQGASITIGPAGITLFAGGTMMSLTPTGITIKTPSFTIVPGCVFSVNPPHLVVS